jgi:hypothetical protein
MIWICITVVICMMRLCRMLGKGERPPSMPEAPPCPVNHSASNTAPENNYESPRAQGQTGAYAKPTILRDVDSRNLEACTPLIEKMAKLQVGNLLLSPKQYTTNGIMKYVWHACAGPY